MKDESSSTCCGSCTQKTVSPTHCSSHISQKPALAPAPRSGVRTKVFSPDLTVHRDSSNKALKEHDIACDICDRPTNATVAARFWNPSCTPEICGQTRPA